MGGKDGVLCDCFFLLILDAYSWLFSFSWCWLFVLVFLLHRPFDINHRAEGDMDIILASISHPFLSVAGHRKGFLAFSKLPL